MKTVFISLATLFVGLCGAEWTNAATPTVSNVRVAQRAGAKLVDITYDVYDADGNTMNISVQVSGDGGLTYTVPAHTFSGAYGAGVTSGTNRVITWNAGADWNGQLVTNTKVRVTATDSTVPVAPAGMAYVPTGPFQMGDSFYEGQPDEQPLHNVNVSPFFIDKLEVSKELWTAVRSWGLAHGYTFGGNVFAAAGGHPVCNVSWYMAAAWCNARSEMEGLTPAYYSDDAQTAVVRMESAGGSLNNSRVKWNANGYRLPTEAEWEKAARGGLHGKRYPWGDGANGSNANYANSGDPFEDDGFADTTPSGYYNGSQTPAGTDMANGYGLYDVAGNVWEWCWDYYGNTYYGDSLANDPHGPDVPSNSILRIMRGGAYIHAPADMRCARRNGSDADGTGPYPRVGTGFRTVRIP